MEHMSNELEKDINEIKISIARVEEKLKVFDSHLTLFIEYEKRLRVLENFKSKSAGYAAALGAMGGFITALIIKLI